MLKRMTKIENCYYFKVSALTRNAKSTRFQGHQTMEGSVEAKLFGGDIINRLQ